MKVAIVAITKKGESVAIGIKRFLPGSKVYIPIKLNNKVKEVFPFEGKLTGLAKKLFTEFEGIVFCMAVGIVVRVIVPYIKDKHADPAIVVVDEEGRFAISLLSGHEGGANALAIRVANILDAEPVITTASESKKNIIIGIGARRGIRKEDVIEGIKYAAAKIGCPLDKARYIATIDLKKDEPGIRGASSELGIPLRIITRDTIKNFKGAYQRSSFVKNKIGVEGVSEPCALLAGRRARLILPKIRLRGLTLAIARED